MGEPTAEVPDDPKERKIAIESMYDTFVKYLDPQIIIAKSSWIYEHKDEFDENNSSREAAVQNLLGWILDDDVCETAGEQFIATLQKLTLETDSLHPAMIDGNKQEKLQMKSLIQILDGSLIKKLSLHDVTNILNAMLEHKIITERLCQKVKDIENPQKCCLVMLKNIKKGKPDWPLVFFSALMRTNPDLVQSITFDQAQQNTDSQMAISDQLEIDDNVSLSEISENFDNWSLMSSKFSKTGSVVYMSVEQIQSPEIKILLQVGNIDANAISSDPKYENQNRRHPAPSEYSDDDDVEGGSDCEETPTLNLREYQKELAENALKGRNTIICAPTGSGKTRVATHIILSHLLDKETPNRKIAFLARTVPLVMQQCKSLKKYLPKNFEITSLTGDSEDSMHLHMILPDNDVIVMTPRILENHLKKKVLPHLGVFSMLIFDECHHTRKGEPYNTLMYSYLNTKKQISEMKERGEEINIKLPQIVGLTASISVEKAVKDEEAVEYILQVCGNLDVNSISCVVKNIDELKKTVPVPQEILKKLREVEKDTAVNRIITIMTNLEKAVTHNASEIKNEQLDALVKKIPTDKKSQQYGQWAVKIRHVVRAFPREENKETISPVRALIIIADYLSAYNVALELHELVLMEHVIAYLDKSFVEFSQNKERSTCEDIYYQYFSEFKEQMKHRLRVENPNLAILKKTLCEYLIEKEGKSCGIIFVRTRALTEALASWLNTCDDQRLQDLKATIFTGTGASVEDGGMTTAEQDEILQRFNSGDIRLLVSTSVGEEGIDIAECNLVIKYNHVGNEVTTVQTRGRSRKAGGMSILLAMDKIIRKERINQEKSKMMERAIISIRNMKRAKIRKLNKKHQQQIMKEEEIFQIVKQQAESHLLNKSFKMVCQLCRKVVIDSKDIRTIFQTHHVVVNSDILKQTKTIPYKGAKFLDEIKLIGTVRCMGEPEEGKHCYNKLGSMMVYSKIPFVVLGIKNFGFDLNGPLGLEFHNQWKKVPYLIDEIGPSDFKRYLPESPALAEKDDESDDDEDSDEDSDDDNDKGNKPPSKGYKPLEPSSRKLREITPSGNPDITTELKNALPTLGANNQDGISTTEPKRLPDASHSYEDKDSGISGSSADRKSSSSNNHGRTEEADSQQILVASNVITNKGPVSQQPSEISSFRSDEKHHLTQVMSSSMVKRSTQRIEDMKFIKVAGEILFDSELLESKPSTFRPLEESTLPSLKLSVETIYSEASISEPESNIASAAEACNTSTDHNDDVTTESNIVRAADACNASIDHNDDVTTESNIVNTTEVCNTSTDHNDDVTTESNIVSTVEAFRVSTDHNNDATTESNIANAAEVCCASADHNDLVTPGKVPEKSSENVFLQNRRSDENAGNNYGESEGPSGSKQENNIVQESHTDNSGDITVPKEVLPESNENASGQNRHSGQDNSHANSSIDHNQPPKSFMDLL